jgi:hypothetical protein
VVDAAKLWAPQKTSAFHDIEKFEEDYMPLNRGGPILFIANEKSNYDILDLNVFETLWDVHERVVNEVNDGNGKTWEDMCYLHDPAGNCMVYGILQFFSSNRTFYNAHVHTRLDLITRISQPRFPDGTPVVREQIFANFTVHPITQAVIRCGATQQQYQITDTDIQSSMDFERSFVDIVGESNDENVTIYRNSPSSLDDEVARSIEADFPYLMVSVAVIVVMVFFNMPQPFTSKPGSGSSAVVRSRFGLSVAGLVLVFLSVFAGFGICAGLREMWVAIHGLFPFALVGIGINDMFLLTSSFDSQDPSLSVEDRVANTMRQTARGIAFTATCAALAFYVGGGLTRFPGIQSFCNFGATGVVCLAVAMLTAYPALLSIDGQRMAGQRMDIWCCVTNHTHAHAVVPVEGTFRHDDVEENAVPTTQPTQKKTFETDPAAAKYAAAITTEEEAAVVESGAAGHPETSNPNEAKPSADLASNPFPSSTSAATSSSSGKADTSYRKAAADMGYIEYFFAELYAPCLRHSLFRLFCVLGCAGMLVANIFGVSHLKQGFEVTDIVPDGYVRDYVEHARPLRMMISEQFTPVLIIFGDMPYHTQEVQENMLRLQHDFVNNTEYNSAFNILWLQYFNLWVKSPTSPFRNMVNADGFLTNEAVFYTAVQVFTSLPPFVGFKAQIVFRDSTDPTSLSSFYIATSRMIGFHVNQRGPVNSLHTMVHTRDLMKRSSLEPVPYLVSAQYTRAEGFKITVREVITFFVIAIISVAIVNCALLPLTFLKPLERFAVILVAITVVGSTVVDYVGNTKYWGTRMEINFITMVFMIMPVSLVMDYTMHILHHYIQQENTDVVTGEKIAPQERILRTMAQIAPSIGMGCLTMLLATVPIAFGKSYAFHMWFRFLFCAIAYSCANALLFLPATLPFVSWVLEGFLYDFVTGGYKHPKKVKEASTAEGIELKEAQPPNAAVANDVVPF